MGSASVITHCLKTYLAVGTQHPPSPDTAKLKATARRELLKQLSSPQDQFMLLVETLATLDYTNGGSSAAPHTEKDCSAGYPPEEAHRIVAVALRNAMRF